jgi:hypothetical protein
MRILQAKSRKNLISVFFRGEKTFIVFTLMAPIQLKSVDFVYTFRLILEHLSRYVHCNRRRLLSAGVNWRIGGCVIFSNNSSPASIDASAAASSTSRQHWAQEPGLIVGTLSTKVTLSSKVWNWKFGNFSGEKLTHAQWDVCVCFWNQPG